jgi:hypothetical protein
MKRNHSMIFWHSPYKPSYLAWPIIEEYFLAFLHVGKWVGEPIFDRWINTISWISTDGFMVIVLKSILWSMIDTIDQREKIFNRWINTSVASMTNSINGLYRYGSIDPFLIMPNYGSTGTGTGVKNTRIWYRHAFSGGYFTCRVCGYGVGRIVVMLWCKAKLGNRSGEAMKRWSNKAMKRCSEAFNASSLQFFCQHWMLHRFIALMFCNN